MADTSSQPPATAVPTSVAPAESEPIAVAAVTDSPVSVVKGAASASTEPVLGKEEAVASAPDPDEDDLDDLDDVLDDFEATRLDAAPIPTASGPGRPIAEATSTGVDSDVPAGVGDDEFAQELQKGMADLLGELESSPEMQKQFEDMIRELSKQPGGAELGDLAIPGLDDVSNVGAVPSAGSSTSGAPKGEESFQDTIRKTMERMKESGDAAGAAAATSATADDDLMAALLKEMENGGSEEDFSKMLLGMMEQLTNKEILYEPMKELDTKYPDWMKNNADKTPAADLKRYKEQQRLVKEIVAKFEEPGYSDENVKSREYILERMQRMQSEGSPPQELVGDMDVATEALGDLDAGCPTQ